ncbi:mobile element protein [Streptomyces sp. NPDC057539]|uniref:mobile element protein n=1 Tax=Streptomyces sp. NPDC057539 TaxID=3346159 RepID=UPI0036A09445
MATDYLAEPADLAAWLPVGEDDPKLLAALKAASRRFRGAVRHPVTFTAGDVVTLDGTGQESVLLPAAPVTAVASLLLDGEALTEGVDFTWSADGFLRRTSRCWPDRLRCIEVSYSHGWDPVPEDIQEVVVDQARAMFRVQPGVQTIQAGGESITYGAQAAVGVTAQWSAAVERYQLNRGDRA